MCHQDVLWLMFKLHQIKGYFSFSIAVSPKGRISVIFNKFEFLELSLSLSDTRDSNSVSISCSEETGNPFDGGLIRVTVPCPQDPTIPHYPYLPPILSKNIWRGTGTVV